MWFVCVVTISSISLFGQLAWYKARRKRPFCSALILLSIVGRYGGLRVPSFSKQGCRRHRCRSSGKCSVRLCTLAPSPNTPDTNNRRYRHLRCSYKFPPSLSPAPRFGCRHLPQSYCRPQLYHPGLLGPRPHHARLRSACRDRTRTPLLRSMVDQPPPRATAGPAQLQTPRPKPPSPPSAACNSSCGHPPPASSAPAGAPAGWPRHHA